MKRDYIIVEGRSYEEVLKLGLLKLKVEESEVEVEVLKEKKGSLFKKPYIQLKLMSKQGAREAYTIEALDNLDIEAEPEDAVEKKQCYIDYLSDGVYITINHFDKEDDSSLNTKILEYLDKKSVKEINIEIIRNIIKEKNSQPTKVAPHQEEVAIDGEVIVEVTKDKFHAYITIMEADGGKAVSLNDAMDKLYQHNIKSGVDYDKLKGIIEYGVFNEKTLIAEGKKPIDGKDGELIYHVDMAKNQQPKVLEDGSVDFKQLDLIKNVKKGDLLLEIQPPTDGVEGENALGEKIPPKQGKLPRVIRGKNVRQSDDALKFYADIDGQVFYRDNKVEVSQVYEVSGDIDNSTGDIKFNGKVIVRGSVKSGFTIESEGDIEVNGVVEGATLITRGNIILNRGIQGNNQAYLQCGGDLITKYIENTKIKVLGNIQAECILHSIVVAKGSIIVGGRRGLVVGGQVKAGEEIVTKTIGSHMGTNTIIEAGADPDEKQRYEDIKKEIEEIEKNLSNLRKTIELLNKVQKSSKLQEDKQKMFIKSMKTYEFLKDKHSSLIKELKALEFKMKDLSKGKVHISNKLYPGVKVGIQNAVRHIYDETSICTLSKKEGEVVIGPYEK